mmetsp:Transcript_25519/g.47561  ORF Transcript_25519/g.47561 Transcript_25519/m.47561 type:complete len:241 (+) Transcript_25519:78-800(+)|eukprot:CAMPEP_0178734498 /NCGR_PEP_ID=MMETSP0744-20121128/1376_1 /TAXON_ID=913974 /ORGANISM="Nitzschia punctata, Strain CCMP561" /LENGTH=240 /DNA_ID=CAMNT_0020386783 /DNA_START=20 /DNA_END=742 /DNA_ORIENTATION=-
MPKVGRNAKLGRAARRVAASDPLSAASSTRGVKENVVAAGISEATAADSKSGTFLTGSNNKADSRKHEDDAADDRQLSRGQRKRLAKQRNFFKKQQLILSSLMLKKQEEQKRRIDGLDAIKEALLGTTTNKEEKGEDADSGNIQLEKPPSTNKAKQKLVGNEVEHMSLILQHPAYKADPFETMQEHLRNTFAEQRQQQERLSKQREEEEKRQKEEKLKFKKEEGMKKKKSKRKYKPRRTS